MNDTEDYIENVPHDVNYDTTQDPENARYFVSYTGVKLPVRMINPLEPEALRNRNTFIVAYFDGQERLEGFKKMVYGEVEISHKYEYDSAGIVRRAEIFMDGDTTELFFNENGAPTAA